MRDQVLKHFNRGKNVFEANRIKLAFDKFHQALTALEDPAIFKTYETICLAIQIDETSFLESFLQDMTNELVHVKNYGRFRI